MTWARIDDRMDEHPKILAFAERRGDALAAQVRAICYCNRNATDGHLTPGAAEIVTLGLRVSGEELVAFGLWERNGSGYVVHDFLDYNFTKRQAERRRKQTSRRVDAWRQRNAPRNGVSNDVTNASVTPEVRTLRTRSHMNPHKAPLTDAEFLAALRANPAYAGIDVDAELGKLDAWLLAQPRRRAKTRRFIVAWLNRCEKPVGRIDPPDPYAKFPRA